MRTKILLFILCWLLGSGLLAHSQAPPAMPPEKVATVLGQRIYFHEAGQGSAVILLHGLGTSSEIWAQNIGPLSAQYHVYALDQIGFGHSDKPLLDYTIGTFVDFLEGFMQAQQISQATLVGSSLGGWIAIDFAVQHPEMVSKLVLANSAGLPFDQPPGVELNPSSLAGMRQVLEAIFYNKQMVNDEFARYAFTKHMQDNDGYTIQRTLAGFSSKNQFEDKKLASIHTPTLVIWGRNDELIPLAKGEQLQKGIPGAKLVVVDQCGHFPHVEKASEFNQKVLQFLALLPQ
jgi:2-hydroxy-6-oxonona-2,4-dienedioate hydrolase